MNKIRVCAFLALVVFIGSVVTDMFSGFMDGWNEAGDQKDFHALPSVSLLVRADDTLPADTLISAAQDTPMYCNTSEVSVQGFRSTKWRWVSFLLFPAGLFALYGFYSVARLVLTATKGEVFVHKNVRRMRIFVYALISVSLLFELQQWGIYHDSVSLLVRADDTLPADTLISAAQDTPMYCNTSEVSVQGFRSTKWRWVSFLLFPAGLFALYGFYSVARLVLTATKGEVFVHKNVRRMRIFVYALISVSLLFELQQWGIYHDLASQVRLEGYEVLPYSFKYAWFNYMLLALFTEIFAIGVKIKEEQDLTV